MASVRRDFNVYLYSRSVVLVIPRFFADLNNHAEFVLQGLPGRD